MIIGIVGSEAVKFTTGTEALARALIRDLLSSPHSVLCSGHCHLGGVDIFAEEIAQELGRETIIYPPKNLSWSLGYRPRNLQIAATSDIVHCITLERLPESYQGMRFEGCYHCRDRRPPHVKSGGC